MRKSIYVFLFTLALSALIIAPASAVQPNTAMPKIGKFRALPTGPAMTPTMRTMRVVPLDRTGNMITFAVPGSVCKPAFALCTVSDAINPAGAVTGVYADAIGAMHGFVRDPQGIFTKFDIPGSVCPTFFSFCTWPAAIAPSGEVAGYFCDANTCHGFLRWPNGSFATFDPVGSQFTQVFGISYTGAVVGFYLDLNFLGHGFVRWPSGAFESFDAQGAVNGTVGVAISPRGTIVGYYNDSNFIQHSFVRLTNGVILGIDPPGSSFSGVSSINPEGTAVGFYQTASPFSYHGFVRTSDGTFSTLIPNTSIAGISPAGTISGDYYQHGFVQTRNGPLIAFDAPNSIVTFVYAINTSGATTGWYIDNQSLGFGFIRFPHHT